MSFWNAIKSIQFLGQSQSPLNLEDCRIWTFASDFCKCCYQSHMGSLKEYQVAANGKSPEQIKTSMYQKKKPNSSPIWMWLWDLTLQVNVFTTGYSFHLISHRKLWKALGLFHCGTESLLKSRGEKTKSLVWKRVPAHSCVRGWIESCICMSCHSALASFSTLGGCGCLSTAPATHRAFLRHKSRCSYFCV